MFEGYHIYLDNTILNTNIIHYMIRLYNMM